MIQNEHFRNSTVSFRTTSQHKLHIDRLAQASGLTTSEYLVHLTSRYAQPIEKFTGDLREVVEQKEENRKLQRRIKRLETDLENADTRVAFEQEQSRKKEGTIAEQGLFIQQMSAEIGGLQKTITSLKAIGQRQIINKEIEEPEKVDSIKETSMADFMGLSLLGILLLAGLRD